MKTSRLASCGVIVAFAACLSASARAEEAPLAETLRKPARKPGDVRAWLGLGAIGFVGASDQARGGVELGIAFGSETTSFVLDTRLAGESLMAPTSAAAAIASLGLLYDKNRKPVDGALGTGSAGIRQYLAPGDTAPFAEGGIGIGYMSMTTDAGPRVSGSGVLPYAEVGLDLMRTRAVGGLLGARLDVPLFGLEGDGFAPDAGLRRTPLHARAHPVLVSAFLAARF